MTAHDLAPHALLPALLAGLVALAAPAAAQTGSDRDVPLIPREVLFGNPDRAGVQVSRDGSHLSWLAPRDGVLNVWVAPADDLDRAVPVTNDRVRGIRSYFWSYTGDILYIQDRGGDENWNLYITDPADPDPRNLTPQEPITNPATGEPMTDPTTGRALRPTARVQEVSHEHPESILIGLNDRDPRFHDVYRVALDDGSRELVQQNDGYAGFLTDDDYEVRFALRPTPAGGFDVFRKRDGEFVPFTEIPADDSLTTEPLGLTPDGEGLYMLDSRGRDTAALVRVELDSPDEPAVLARDDRADVSGVMLHPVTGEAQAASSNYTRRSWTILDPDVERDFKVLRDVADGDFSVSSRTSDDRTWVVTYVMDNGPVRYYLYDRDSKDARFLFTNRTALDGLPLASMHPVVIEARDGTRLVSYYSLPVWADRDNDARPDRPLPTVLLVHGGPWARDSWGYNSIHQWLANRGYAVLSVNFRGSTGFGKAFVNAGDREWAAKMHDDLIDAVAWAVEHDIAQRDRVAIMGGSYGGYAALAGLTFTPEQFAAGVSIVGPSNLITLLESIPPYWASFRDQLRRRVGDIDTPAGRVLLRNRSPLTHVDEINKPLLIGQGANDPRVKQRESDQIVTALQDKDVPVTYVLYPDEGHGFARPENRLSFYAVAEAFLAQHIGGVYEDIGDDFTNSSITVPEGADQVPGLSSALD